MSLQKLDHDGTFSLFDLAGLRDQFDLWCDHDRRRPPLALMPAIIGTANVKIQSLPLQQAPLVCCADTGAPFNPLRHRMDAENRQVVR